MTVSVLSAASRRAMLAVSLAAVVVCASSGLRAQDAAKPAAAPDQLKFSYDGPMILIYQIKPERAEDFEALWAGIRAGLAKSSDADLKSFGETLYPYKVESANVYVFRLDAHLESLQLRSGQDVVRPRELRRSRKGDSSREPRPTRCIRSLTVPRRAASPHGSSRRLAARPLGPGRRPLLCRTDSSFNGTPRTARASRFVLWSRPCALQP